MGQPLWRLGFCRSHPLLRSGEVFMETSEYCGTNERKIQSLCSYPISIPTELQPSRSVLPRMLRVKLRIPAYRPR